MAESEAQDAEINWFRPAKRAIFLPESFHAPKRLLRLIQKRPFDIRWNDDFYQVMQECGSQRKEGNWINSELLEAYTEWHKAGEAFCLSVFQDGVRVGGIYMVCNVGACLWLKACFHAFQMPVPLHW